MSDRRFAGMGRAAGLAMVLSFVTNLAGVVMFNTRMNTLPSFTFLVWERSLFMASVVFNALGLVLLEGYLDHSEGKIPARTGATAYLFAGIAGITAEALDLGQWGQNLYPLFVVHVVLSFLAQIAIGVSLRQASVVASWIAWATILWNLFWLVLLPLVTPQDIYFPILHAFMLPFIGIALLRKAR